MSGFDVQMQSDALVQRDRQFYDGARYQMQDNMMGGLRQSVGQIHQGLELGQQLAIRKAEADMRNQVAQQEIQFNEFKLRSMAQLDALDMSKHQVEAARLQNEMAQFQFDQAKKKASYEDPNADSMRDFSEFVRNMDGPEALAAQGLFLSANGRSLEEVPINTPEWEDRMKGIREARRGRQNPDSLVAQLMRDYSKYSKIANDPYTPDGQTKQDARRMMQHLADRLRTENGIELSGGQGGPATPTPQPTTALAPTGQEAPAEQRWRIPGIWPEGKEYRDLEPFQRSAAQALQDPRWQEEGTLWSELANRGVAIKAAQAIGYLSQQWLMGAENRNIGEDMAHRYVMGSVEEGNPELYGFILRASEVEDDALRSLLRLKFNLGDAALSKVMAAIDKEEADMRKRAAKQR